MILRKISKTGATGCQILRLECTKFRFRWGSAPDPAGGAYSAQCVRPGVCSGGARILEQIGPAAGPKVVW